MKSFFLSLFLISILSNTGLSSMGMNDKTENSNSALSVFVSILPQKFFVEEIGANRVTVHVLVPPGKNPAIYEPTPSQVMALGNAEILYITGVPFENIFLPVIRNSLNNLSIIDTAENIVKRSMDPDEDHPENKEDPHVWMSPVNGKIIAETILNSLIKHDPDGKEFYYSRYKNLIDRLDLLHTELEAVLSGMRGSPLFVYHPAFGYFADTYGLKQIAIETGGKSPLPGNIENIINEIILEEVNIILVQPEFPGESAEEISRLTGTVIIPISPLNPDYINNLKMIAEKLRIGYNNE